MARLTRQQAQHLLASRKRRGLRSVKRPPEPLQPDAIRVHYYRELLRLVVKPMQAFVEPLVLSELQRLAHYESIKDAFAQDGPLLRAFFRFLLSMLLVELPDARTKGMVATIAIATDKQRATQFRRTIRQSIGVDVIASEKGIEKKLSKFADSNRRLIKSIKTQYVNEVASVVQSAVSEGRRAEELIPLIKERGKVSESRARVIARDQVGKLASQLDRTRQENAGLGAYFWRGMRDNRERKLHFDREGKRFEWANPPSETADDGHAGIPINCRCYAEPDIEGMLQEAEKLLA